MSEVPATPLPQLAHLYGILTSYYDVEGRLQHAPEEALLAVLKGMGAPLSTVSDVPSALRERHQSRWQRILEPVIVAWEGKTTPLEVRLPASLADATLECSLEFESGGRQTRALSAANLPVQQVTDIEGARYALKTISLPGDLPPGYHRLTLQVQGRLAESIIISAPARAYQPPESMERGWGVFLPLYALRSRTSWGSGDFSDLDRLAQWVAGLGGNVVASLPLVSTLSEELSSPYTPLSRLMWNEFYIDVTGAPEMETCPAARDMVASASFQTEMERVRRLPLVDYPCQMALKQRVLEELCRCCFSGASGSLESLRAFVASHPEVENYARFRAAGERHGSSWQRWPRRLQQGILQPGDYDEQTKRYHIYVQWLASRQMEALALSTRSRNINLYLDLPLGVQLNGYDVWRNQELYVLEACGGAPPDSFFTKGQDWGFPPLHPERLRERHYLYYIACLRHSLKCAGTLRIDHVMGLHRLFWVPRGMKASEGVYVSYPSDELYAVVTLESQRNRAVIVGEDLGTVPSEVRTAMSRYGLHRMYIVQYEAIPHIEGTLRDVEPGMLAALNTHDMPTFSAFWQGMDIEERVTMGLLDGEGAQRERQKRAVIKEAIAAFLQRQGLMVMDSLEMKDIHRAILRFLGRSPAFAVLVNLEDLWLETQSQNTPGTVRERPNWRRKARYSFEEFSTSPEVTEVLTELGRYRKWGTG